jgi:hypothetical protein
MAKADKAVATVITTSEVSAASFLFGLAQGKFGGVAVVGVPADLLAGLGLHVLGFAGIGGVNANHLHAFADGALASFFNKLGRDVGYTLQTDGDRARIAKSGKYATLPGGSFSVGGNAMDGVTGGAALADEELARMVAAGRR